MRDANEKTPAADAGPVLSEELGLANRAAAAFETGRLLALAGEPCPTAPAPAVQGWQSGNAKRRILAGEAIGFVCQGTMCDGCGGQNWGWRLGCRCNGPVRHGALVDDGLADGACAKFMTVEELRAIGKPVIDTFTGADVPLQA